MSESADTARLIAECETYWRSTGVPRRMVASMRNELKQHLEEARSDGRSVDDVVGSDPAAFAESWAAEYRVLEGSRSWDEIIAGEPGGHKRFEMLAYALGAVTIVGGVLAGSLLRGESNVDNEVWRWVWTLAALGFGVGEIFTAAFFLLPFSIGALAAAILAWLGVGVAAQWLVFFGVSLVAFAYLRRFIAEQDRAPQPSVGANRWVGLGGMVLEDIDPDRAVGMVRVESEEWRATTEDGSTIPAGTHIRVVAMRGARMVVEPTD